MTLRETIIIVGDSEKKIIINLDLDLNVILLFVYLLGQVEEPSGKF